MSERPKENGPNAPLLRKRRGGTKLDDIQLSRLLSGRNEPSVLEKEASLQKLLEELGPESRRRRWRLELLVPALGVVAVLALLVLPKSQTDVQTELFAPRGVREAGLELRCLDASNEKRTDCMPGSILALAPTPPEGHPYFAAFAVRDDGALLWYFPEEEAVPSKAIGDEGEPVTRGILLDRKEHPPGTYQLVAVFSEEALDREALRSALGPELLGREGLQVIRRSFEVVLPVENP